MRRFLSVFLVLIFPTLLWTCKKDDPGPDLGSSTISFTWNVGNLIDENYYVVISDTSGNVLSWKEIAGAEQASGQQVDLPYPSDPKLALVTFIRSKTFHMGDQALSAYTFTDIPAGSYTYNLTPTQDLKPHDKTVSLRIVGGDQFSLYAPHVIPDALIEADYVNNDVIYTLNLYNDNPTNDLVLTLGTYGTTTTKYRYIEGLTDGLSLSFDLVDFDEDFIETPAVDLDYPAHKDFNYSYGSVTAIKPSGQQFVCFGQWLNNQVPKWYIPDVPNLSPMYETVMVGLGLDGAAYTWDIKSAEPVTQFIPLNATLEKVTEFSTKRISIDMPGDGDVFIATGQWGDANTNVTNFVYTPKTSKIRINPPQFPQDLLAKEPGLDKMKNVDFQIAYAMDFNMSYKEFYEFKIQQGFFPWPDYLRSASFGLGVPSGGRKTAPGKNDILKFLGKDYPQANGN